MKNVLLLASTDVDKDPRIWRQARFLSKTYNVYLVSDHQSISVDGVKNFSWKKKFVRRSLLSRIYLFFALLFRAYWIADKLYFYKFFDVDSEPAGGDIDIDIVFANDIETLPVGVKLSRKYNAKLVFDAHEYSPGQYENNIVWLVLIRGYVQYVLRKNLPYVDQMFTVGEGIAKKYENEFGVKPEVIFNAPFYRDLKVKKPEENVIKLVHHGNAVKGRHLEQMVFMMDSLGDRFTLDLVLMPVDPSYLDYLQDLVDQRLNVRILPPVPMKSIPDFLNAHYDIGVFLLSPNTTNHRLTLPNKFFEYIQARLAIAVGPSEEMARIVNQYGLGVVSDDFTSDSLAQQISPLSSDDVLQMKIRSNEIVEHFSFDSISKGLLECLER